MSSTRKQPRHHGIGSTKKWCQFFQIHVWSLIQQIYLLELNVVTYFSYKEYMIFGDVRPYSLVKMTNVSEETATSFFRAKEWYSEVRWHQRLVASSIFRRSVFDYNQRRVVNAYVFGRSWVQMWALRLGIPAVRFLFPLVRRGKSDEAKLASYHLSLSLYLVTVLPFSAGYLWHLSRHCMNQAWLCII